MARLAELSIEGKAYKVGLSKLDRKKIYGWTTIDISDENQQKCTLATIADGQYILPSGSISMAGFNDNGEFVPRSDLVGINDKGEKVDKVLSIFEKQVELFVNNVSPNIFSKLDRIVFDSVVRTYSDSIFKYPPPLHRDTKEVLDQLKMANATRISIAESN